MKILDYNLRKNAPSFSKGREDKQISKLLSKKTI